MKRLTSYVVAALAVVVAPLLLSAVASATAAAVTVTAAGAGTYPSGAAYGGVPVGGLRFGIGVEIPGDTSARGEFQGTLLGTSASGQPQNIAVEGKASSGSSSDARTATFSGTCTVDMADGTAPSTGVPFTVTVATDAGGKTTLSLKLGASVLPAATVDAGSVTIQ